MVKLVHFQGYPAQLLPVMVTHVPSMHICLQFIPELVTQPQTDKQVGVVGVVCVVGGQFGRSCPSLQR